MDIKWINKLKKWSFQNTIIHCVLLVFISSSLSFPGFSGEVVSEIRWLKSVDWPFLLEKWNVMIMSADEKIFSVLISTLMIEHQHYLCRNFSLQKQAWNVFHHLGYQIHSTLYPILVFCTMPWGKTLSQSLVQTNLLHLKTYNSSKNTTPTLPYMKI